MTLHNSSSWLCTILPTDLSTRAGGKQLEVHKRLVHLATLREEALLKLQQLDAIKISLTEKKAIQQGRLIAALDARLASAHAAVEPHRVAVHDHIKALERAAACYSSILHGLSPELHGSDWHTATQQYQHLQQQQQYYQQGTVPPHISSSLAAALQPTVVGVVEVVEQLRAEKDQLVQQLQQAHSQCQQVSQQLQQEHAARLLAEQQQHSMQQELQSLRQLAEQVTKQVHAHGMAQHHQQQQAPVQGEQQLQSSSPELQQQPVTDVAQHTMSTASNSAAADFLQECQQLRQQMQDLFAAANTCGSNAAGSAGQHQGYAPHGQAAPQQPQAQQQQGLQQQELDGLQDILHNVQATNSVMLMESMQQLHAAVLGNHAQASDSSSNSRQLPTLLPLSRESRLREAYQQMLRQVQARYQQELLQHEQQHDQAVQALASKHNEALTRLTEQHQQVCGHLAATAAETAELKQQAARLQQDKQKLQLQVDKLQADVSSSAAAALAVEQIRHEQQLLALKQEHEQANDKAQEQLQHLQQQNVKLPTPEGIAAMVEAAAARHLANQVEQQQQAAALQQLKQRHVQLLQELAQLKQLQEEPSASSTQGTWDGVQEWQQKAPTAPAPGSDAVCNRLEHALQQGLGGLQQPSSSLAGAPDASRIAELADAGASRTVVVDSPGHTDGDSNSELSFGIGSKAGPAAASRQPAHKAADNLHSYPPASLSPTAPARQDTAISTPTPVGTSSIGQGDVHPASSRGTKGDDRSSSSQQASAISALIAAVLGPGPHAQAVQAAHQKRTASQQQQQIATLQGQQQQHTVVKRQQVQQQQQTHDDHVATLDQLLGSEQQQTVGTAADAPPALWQQSSGRSKNTAAANAAQVWPISTADSCSPRDNKQKVPLQASAQQHRQLVRSRASSRSPSPMSRQERQQQQHKQQQSTQATQHSSCLRCGSNGQTSPGHCCFHPGLVAVPGPLMYSPEWHACRANCSPDMPGCYTRPKHYYMPSFAATSTAAGTNYNAGKLAYMSSKSFQGMGGGAGTVVAAGKVESTAICPMPRSTVPRPITPNRQ